MIENKPIRTAVLGQTDSILFSDRGQCFRWNEQNRQSLSDPNYPYLYTIKVEIDSLRPKLTMIY